MLNRKYTINDNNNDTQYNNDINYNNKKQEVLFYYHSLFKCIVMYHTHNIQKEEREKRNKYKY